MLVKPTLAITCFTTFGVIVLIFHFKRDRSLGDNFVSEKKLFHILKMIKILYISFILSFICLLVHKILHFSLDSGKCIVEGCPGNRLGVRGGDA